MTIPDLLESTGAPLTQVLHALQDVRHFQLVEFVETDCTVQLTATGSQAATVVAKEAIQREANHLLGH